MILNGLFRPTKTFDDRIVNKKSRLTVVANQTGFKIFYGARSESRTRTPLPAVDFESTASTSSAIRASSLSIPGKSFFSTGKCRERDFVRPEATIRSHLLLFFPWSHDGSSAVSEHLQDPVFPCPVIGNMPRSCGQICFRLLALRQSARGNHSCTHKGPFAYRVEARKT